MSIRKKTLLVISITFLILILSMMFVTRIIVMRGFKTLEDEQIQISVKQVINKIDSTLLNVQTVVNDWAPWDATYVFVQDGNKQYIAKNLADHTLLNLKINFMVFFNNAGRIVFAKYVDLSSKKSVPFPDDLHNIIRKSALLTNKRSSVNAETGIFMMDTQPIFMASRPIVKSDLSGQPQGVLVIGLYMDAFQIKRISNITQVKFAVCPFDKNQMPPDFMEAKAFLKKNPGIFIRPENSNVASGYAMVKDIEKKPAFILKTMVPRKIWQQGKATFLYYTLSLFIIGSIFSIVIIILLEKNVLAPLCMLSVAVNSITKTGDDSKRLPVLRDDELGNLATKINGMLIHLGETREQLLTKTRDELKDLKNAAEVATQAKSDFLTIMSHELKTPLNHIIGFTELVVGNHFGDLNETQTDYLNIVLQSARHLLMMVNDILQISKVGAKKINLELLTMAVQPFLEKTVAAIRKKVIDKGIEMTLNVAEEAPIYFHADFAKLRQVLLHILSNAVKFTDVGGQITINAGFVSEINRSRYAMSDKTFIEVSIRDTGIGLKKEDLESIFDSFVQLEKASTRQYGGTGMGLTLARTFIELHGGYIWAESDGPGKGCTFTFIIPDGVVPKGSQKK